MGRFPEQSSVSFNSAITNFFFYFYLFIHLFILLFFYTIEEAPHYHAPLVSGVPLKEAVSVKAVRCIRGRREFALKLCPVNHLSS